MRLNKLRFFYDSACPLCVKEVNWLGSYDNKRAIEFVDVLGESFLSDFPNLNQTEALKILHVQLPSGEFVYGLDASYEAWNAVNKGYYVKALRWPVIRWFANLGYWVFARYRAPISLLLTGKSRCVSNTNCTYNSKGGSLD